MGWYLFYVVEALAYDSAALGTPLYIVLIPLYRRLGFNPAQRLYLCVVSVGACFGLVLAGRWQLFAYFKNSFDFDVLQELTAGKYSNLLIWVGMEAFLRT